MDFTSGDTSLAELIAARARDSATHPFLEDARSARVLDYAGLAARVDEWRSLFAGRGLEPQAPVIVACVDPLAFSVVHLAAIACGLRSVPLDPSLPSGEPTRTSDLIGGGALVVSDVPLADGRFAGSAIVVDLETLSPEPASASQSTGGPESSGAGTALPAGSGSAVLFTSGSTGAPKGVELPEAQLLFVANQIARNNELTADDRGFNSLPLFHVNAQVVGLLATLVAGATLVVDASFHRTGFWGLLREHRITWLNAVPSILAVLTREGAAIPDIGLRFIRSASAPLPDAVREALGEVPLILSWGMTEGASQIAVTPLGDDSHPGSVGLPAGSEVRVRRETGEDADADETGALWIRGSGVITSYLFGRAPERFDADGWLDTGDVGRIDANGYVYLQGRSDDVINRGGEKVYPAELEEVLLGDPRVLEAVVVAVPHEILGSVPKAYVIPVSGDSDDFAPLVADLTARCESELPRFKRPTQIEVVPDLPRASTGKVQRSRLRALAGNPPA